MKAITRTLCRGSARIQNSKWPNALREWGITSSGASSTIRNGRANTECLAYIQENVIDNRYQVYNALIANPQVRIYSIFPDIEEIRNKQSDTKLKEPYLLENINLGGLRQLRARRTIPAEYMSYSANLPWPEDPDTSVDLTIDVGLWHNTDRNAGTDARKIQIALPGLRDAKSRANPFEIRDYHRYGLPIGNSVIVFTPGFGGPSTSIVTDAPKFIPFRTFIDFTLTEWTGAEWGDPSIRIKMPLHAFYSGMYAWTTDASNDSLSTDSATPTLNWSISTTEEYGDKENVPTDYQRNYDL